MRQRGEACSGSLVLNERLAGGVVMESDAAGGSTTVVCELICVDSTVATVVILQLLLLLMLEIDRLVVNTVRTGLLRLCVIKLWAAWLLARVTVRLLRGRGRGRGLVEERL